VGVRVEADLPAHRSSEQLPASAYRSTALSAVQAPRGTEGSSPFPSSGESASHRFRRRFQGLDVNTERVVACFGQYLNRSHYLEDQRRLGYNLAAGHAKEDRFRR